VLAVDPQTSAILYACTGTGDGVFKSTDGGANWSPSNTGLPNESIWTLVIDPQVPATIYAGTAGGVFKSTNGGASWSARNAGLPNPSEADALVTLAIDPQTPTTLYAGTSRQGVFKSTDAGGSWSPSNAGLADQFIRALAVDPQAPATLYAAGSDLGGLVKSTNGGASWSASNAGLLDYFVTALAIDSQVPTTVYAGTSGGGTFRSTDGGASWRPSNAGLVALEILAVAVDPLAPATLYTSSSGGGVFKSTNGGAGWSASHAGLPNRSIETLAVDPKTAGTVYAGTSDPVEALRVFKSTDGGASWGPTGTSLPFHPCQAGFCFERFSLLIIDPQTPAILYAGTSGGLFKSTNGGITWSLSRGAAPPEPTPTMPAYGRIMALAIDPKTPTSVYSAEIGAGAVVKSTDGGQSWSASNLGLENRWTSALAIDAQTPAILYAGTDDGVFKSTNGGSSWSPSNVGLPSYVPALTLAIDPQTPTTLYVGTYGYGVFKSADGGASWSPVTVGFSSLVRAWGVFRGLAVNPRGTCLHAATGTGTFGFATRIDAICLPPPPLVAALSTTSQVVSVGAPARTFATVDNVSGSATNAEPDGVDGVSCGVTQLTGAPTLFTFQAVDPATDQPVAQLNTPVDIPPATGQKFRVTLTPSAPVCPTEILFGFNCTNSRVADVLVGRNTLLLSAGSPAECGVSVTVTANRASFVVGQTLIAGGSVTNPGLSGVAADFYAGVVRPDGSIQFVTPSGLEGGHVSDLGSFRPLAVNASMATPFSVSQSSVFTHQWTADDQRGPYVFFVLAVKTGALAGGTVGADQVLKLATATFAFP
jgi:photosystem II stability/assembly factor-like uncharacterized protein